MICRNFLWLIETIIPVHFPGLIPPGTHKATLPGHSFLCSTPLFNFSCVLHPQQKGVCQVAVGCWYADGRTSFATSRFPSLSAACLPACSLPPHHHFLCWTVCTPNKIYFRLVCCLNGAAEAAAALHQWLFTHTASYTAIATALTCPAWESSETSQRPLPQHPPTLLIHTSGFPFLRSFVQ